MATPANSLWLHTAKKQLFLPWREETWGQTCSFMGSRASQQRSSCEIACLHPICLSNLRWHEYQLTRSSINVISYFTFKISNSITTANKYTCSEEVMTVWFLLISKYRETKPPPPKKSLFSCNDSLELLAALTSFGSLSTTDMERIPGSVYWNDWNHKIKWRLQYFEYFRLHSPPQGGRSFVTRPGRAPQEQSYLCFVYVPRLNFSEGVFSSLYSSPLSKYQSTL